METKNPQVNKEFGIRKRYPYMRFDSGRVLYYTVCMFDYLDCFKKTYPITRDAINSTCIVLN